MMKNKTLGTLYQHKETKVIYRLRRLPITNKSSEDRVLYLQNLQDAHDTILHSTKSEWEPFIPTPKKRK